MNTNEPSELVAAPLPSRTPSRLKRWSWLFAKVGVAGAAFAYVLTRQSWSDLAEAMSQITVSSITAAVFIQFACLTIAATRWRALMRAYGADHLPGFAELVRVNFVGHFYNTYLPGAVGGDVLRGVVTRRAFPEGGATASIAIVLVERLLGLAATFALAALAAPFDTKRELAYKVLPYALLGILGVGGTIVALAHGQRVAPYLPARVAALVRNLPALTRPGLLPGALLLSFVIQALFVVCVHVLVAAIHPSVHWTHSLVAVPLTAIASYFPLSVAGAGPRDAVMVALYALGGVPRAEGLAASLSLLVVTLIAAGMGGLWQLVAPLDVAPRADTNAPRSQLP